MVSRLATALIQLPHPSGDASDMLWKYATLTDVTRSRTPISEQLTVELAQFLDGASARSFAQLLPSAELAELAFCTNPSNALCKGLVENPFTADSTLEAIAAKGISPEGTSNRLARRAAFRNAAVGTPERQAAIDALVESSDAAPLIDLATTDPLQLLIILSPMSNMAFRALVLDGLDTNSSDTIHHALLGIIDPASRAVSVDACLAEWLCTSTSLPAAASRELLGTDQEAANQLLAVLDGDARSRLARHESLWSVVQYRRRQSTGSAKGHAHPMDRSMLNSMRLAGMGVAEISALIFNSKVELEPAELANELSGIDAVRLAAYFMGSNPRHPAPGEIDALVAALDPFEQHKLAEAMVGDIDHLPWADELLVGIPRRYQNVEARHQLEALDRVIRAEIDSDAKAWEVVLSMAEEWEGNLRSLVNAAHQL
jgi:hypothetical protein